MIGFSIASAAVHSFNTGVDFNELGEQNNNTTSHIPDNKEYKYTLCQLRELHKDSFGFLLWIKHLVAKIYFNQGDQPLNEDLNKYLLKNY